MLKTLKTQSGKFNLETKRPIYKIHVFDTLKKERSEMNLSSLEAIEFSQKYKAIPITELEAKKQRLFNFKIVENKFVF